MPDKDRLATDVSYAMCTFCDHFVDHNYTDDEVVASGTGTVTTRDPDGLLVTSARYVHLDDGDQEFDHDPSPGEARTLAEWQLLRPELFRLYPDGRIGPNSDYYSRRGKMPDRQEAKAANV